MKTVLVIVLFFTIAAFVVINYTTKAKSNNSTSELKLPVENQGKNKANNISDIKVKDIEVYLILVTVLVLKEL